MFKVILLLLPLVAINSISIGDAIRETNNPRLKNKWVTASKGILSKKQRKQLNTSLSNLEKKTGIEYALVLRKNLGVSSVKEYAHQLFNAWQIGKRDKNNGLLFVLSIEQKGWAFETGYGLEVVLPDSKQGSITRALMVPEFRKGDFGAGVTKGTLAIIKYLASVPLDQIGAKAPQQEYKSKKKKKVGWSIVTWLYLFLYLSSFVVILSLGLIVFKKPNNVEKAERLHLIFIGLLLSGALLVLFFLPVTFIALLVPYPFSGLVKFSLVMGSYAIIWKRWNTIVSVPKKRKALNTILVIGLIVLFLRPLYFYASYTSHIGNSYIELFYIFLWMLIIPLHYQVKKRVRYGKHHCNKCQNEMELLDEEADDKWLDAGQRVEEQVASIDYDVWFCGRCENIQVEPYVSTSSFEQCEKCNYMTFRFIEDQVLQSASYTHSGSGVKTYKCSNCSHGKRVTYTIPRKTRSSSSSSSSFGGGGGGFSGGGGGGSFGGGSSGGGGASGSW